MQASPARPQTRGRLGRWPSASEGDLAAAPITNGNLALRHGCSTDKPGRVERHAHSSPRVCCSPANSTGSLCAVGVCASYRTMCAAVLTAQLRVKREAWYNRTETLAWSTSTEVMVVVAPVGLSLTR